MYSPGMSKVHASDTAGFYRFNVYYIYVCPALCTQVDVTNRSASVDLANYVFNGEWELLSIGVKRNEIVYACCVEPYPDVTFSIVIRRRTLYYLFNVVFPCLWLTVLSLVGFWLPPDSGEKITLGITVLLAFSVFMLMIAENMPATSEFVPLMGGQLLYASSS